MKKGDTVYCSEVGCITPRYGSIYEILEISKDKSCVRVKGFGVNSSEWFWKILFSFMVL